MRIALVSTPSVRVPPRGYGGTELVVGELAKGLDALGHHVTLFATGDSEWHDLRYVFDRPVWPPDTYSEVLHCEAAAREIARGGYDVVHAHLPAALAFEGEYGAPLVYTLHHAHEERLSRLYAQRPEVTFVAISERQRELEPTLARCEVVHHGLDPGAFALGAGRGGYAFFLGRVNWCKGPDLAIEAARRAGLDVVLAGRPHPEPEASEEWREGIVRALRQPGVTWVEEADARAKSVLFAGARALLMPIRWEEPFGLVMIEAMLSGCPVVAFPRGAAGEIVEPGVTGWLVRDVAEMAEALRAAASFDRRACRERARERFSAARMTRDYLAVYRRTIAAARRGEGALEESGVGLLP